VDKFLKEDVLDWGEDDDDDPEAEFDVEDELDD
jgi:hypothetical protein